MDKNSAFSRKYSFQKIKNFHKHQPQWERRPFYAWGNADLETNQLTGDNKGTRHVNSNCWEKTIPLGKCGLIFEMTRNVLVHFQQTKLKHFNYESFIQNFSFHSKHKFFPLFAFVWYGNAFLFHTGQKFRFWLCFIQASRTNFQQHPQKGA